jgi:hypothetical protein
VRHYDLQLERIPADGPFRCISSKRRKHDNYGSHGDYYPQDEQDRTAKEKGLHTLIYDVTRPADRPLYAYPASPAIFQKSPAE